MSVASAQDTGETEAIAEKEFRGGKGKGKGKGGGGYGGGHHGGGHHGGGHHGGGHHGGGHHGGGGHGGGGWGEHIEYHTQGQELFSGDDWILAIPLLLIPLIVFGCWYMWGGSGGGDYGHDRIGYSSSGTQVEGAYGGYARAADYLDKATHQRIFDSIKEQ